MAAPAGARRRYEAWAEQHEPLVRKLQEVANILVFLLPGNSVDGELAQEAGLAAINLVVMYHNLLFAAKRERSRATQAGRTGGLFAAREAVRTASKSAAGGSSSSSSASSAPASASPAAASASSAHALLSRPALRLALTVCAHTEVVAEMVAIRFVGEARKWPAITAIEGLKSLSRLWMLFTAARGQPRPGEDGDPATLRSLPRVQRHGAQYPSTDGDGSGGGGGAGMMMGGPFAAPPGTGGGGAAASTPDGKPAPAGPDDPAEVMRRTVSYRHRHRQLWAKSSARPPPAGASSPVSAAQVVAWGEALHILRPLVFALLRWRMGPKRWTPLLASALMDVLSSSCVDAAGAVEACQADGGFGQHGNPSALEVVGQAVVGPQAWGVLAALVGRPTPSAAFLERKEAAQVRMFSLEDRAEFSRRRSLWLYYLLRDPLFDHLTRPAVGTVAGLVGRLPLVGGLADYAMFSLLYYQKKHFWFSGSSSR